jgi:hypothetical protein
MDSSFPLGFARDRRWKDKSYLICLGGRPFDPFGSAGSTKLSTSQGRQVQAKLGRLPPTSILKEVAALLTGRYRGCRPCKAGVFQDGIGAVKFVIRISSSGFYAKAKFIFGPVKKKGRAPLWALYPHRFIHPAGQISHPSTGT